MLLHNWLATAVCCSLSEIRKICIQNENLEWRTKSPQVGNVCWLATILCFSRGHDVMWRTAGVVGGHFPGLNTAFAIRPMTCLTFNYPWPHPVSQQHTWHTCFHADTPCNGLLDFSIWQCPIYTAKPFGNLMVDIRCTWDQENRVVVVVENNLSLNLNSWHWLLL